MRKKALLVGINRYPDPGDALRGCINDVLLVGKTLREQYGFTGNGDLRVLTDSQATTKAILDGLSWLTDGAAPGDSLVFHYSGHGSQVPDRNGDETTDRLDEILCPYDLDWEHPLTDDDLADVCRRVPRGALLTAILDCCHSGTALREPARPADCVRPRFLPGPADPGRAGGRPARRFGVSVTKSNGILIAACRDDQTSADAYIEGTFHGAHTFYLWRSLRAAGWAASYRSLVAATGSALAAARFDQVPQLEGPARLLSSAFLESPSGSRASAAAANARGA